MNRYEQLRTIRENWCRRSPRAPDRCGIVIELDGSLISDVPSFYLALGEAVNGADGYFGACLDSLEDCLYGDFGLRPPFTVRIRHSDAARRAIENGQKEWRERYRAGCTMVDDGKDGNDARLQRCDASASPNDVDSYWDALVQTFSRHKVAIILHNA